MYLLTDTALVTSASDLTQASNCEFGFLRVAELGNLYEGRRWDRYRAEFGDAVVEFDIPSGRSADILRDFAAQTRDVQLAGASVAALPPVHPLTTLEPTERSKICRQGGPLRE